MRKKLSLSEFAKKLGVSRPAIVKAISTGRIPAECLGERELSTGRKVPVVVDAIRARSHFLNEGGLALTMPKSDPPIRPRAQDDAESPASESDDHVDADHTIPAISQSRAISEAYKAKWARLEYEMKAGKLVDAQEFRALYTANVVAARTRLLGVPSKSKGRIPHLSVDDIGVLDELIRETLEGVADGFPQFDQWLESMRGTWWPLVAGTSSTKENLNE